MDGNEELYLLARILERYISGDGWLRTYGAGENPEDRDGAFPTLEWSEDLKRVKICLYNHDQYIEMCSEWLHSPESKNPEAKMPALPIIRFLMAITMTPDAKVFEISSTLHEKHRSDFKAMFKHLGFAVKEVDFS